jgi:hypothetical protein
MLSVKGMVANARLALPARNLLCMSGNLLRTWRHLRAPAAAISAVKVPADWL